MKKYDVSAKVGSYQKDGQTKAIWKTVGQVRDDGNGEYLLLDKTFNPAGIPCEPHKDQISLSLFTPRDNNQQGQSQQAQSQQAQPVAQVSQADVDNAIPF